ncbi:MAG: hypothetical protein KC464_10510, partial [Myxococcales bacterium]|nr:hypothetical protein [Myxococcales bacterium]
MSPPAPDDVDAPEALAAFRAEVRAWLEENCPPSLRTPATSAEEVWGGRRATFPSDDARRWLER